MGLRGNYPGERLLGEEIPGGQPLIEGFMWQRDNTILMGAEKSGKSILGMQIAAALTTQEPFLGEYEVPKAVNVAYVQAEGKVHDTQSNLRNMVKVIPFDASRFCLFYYPSIALDKPEGYQFLIEEINKWKKPDVIILDPLYMLMSGDMIDNVAARDMVRNMRQLGEHYDATLLIIHHAHRPKRTEEGHVMDEGDDSIFGSFVWKAFVDQVYYLRNGRDKIRQLSCDTQRMGKCVEKLTLRLVEPVPLYFQIAGEGEVARPTEEIIKKAITKLDELTIKSILTESQASKRHIWNVVSSLVAAGMLQPIQTVGEATRWIKVSPKGWGG